MYAQSDDLNHSRAFTIFRVKPQSFPVPHNRVENATVITVMDNSWSEIRRVCDNDPPTASPISTITLDPHQELVWVGNDRVRTLLSVFTSERLWCALS